MTKTIRKPKLSATVRDINYIKGALRLHQINPTYKVGIYKKGFGYYHMTLGKAHQKTSWYLNTDVFSKLNERFEVNLCAKNCNLEATLIKRV